MKRNNFFGKFFAFTFVLLTKTLKKNDKENFNFNSNII